MAADDTDAMKEISEEFSKQKTSVFAILDAIVKTGKAIKSNNADTSKYTGILKSIHDAHELFIGGVDRSSRIVYNLLHKYSTDSSKAAKDTLAAQKQQLAELRAQHHELETTTEADGTQYDPATNTKRRALLDQMGELGTTIDESEAGVAAMAEGSAASLFSFEGILAVAETLAPELALAGLALEGIEITLKDIWDSAKNYREFNASLIQANATLENRSRLYMDALNTSIRLGVSQQETVGVVASLVAHGQQYNSDLRQNVAITTMLHEGLGLSVQTGAELLSTAQMTHQSYAGLADTLADVQSRLGLSAEEAAKMAISINKSLLFFGPQGSGATSRITSQLAPYAAALQSIGRADLIPELSGLVDEAAKNPFSLMRMQGAGANGQFDVSVLLNKMKSASYSINNPNITDDRYRAAFAGSQEGRLGVGDYDELVRSLSMAFTNYGNMMQNNPEYRKQQTLLAVFNAQMSQSNAAMDRLKNAYDSLISAAAIPLMNVMTHLANFLSPLLQYLADVLQSHEDDFRKAIDVFAIAAKELEVTADQTLLWLDKHFRPWADTSDLQRRLAKDQASLISSIVDLTMATTAQTELYKQQAEKAVSYAGYDRPVNWAPDGHGGFNLTSEETAAQQARHFKDLKDHLTDLHNRSTASLTKTMGGVVQAQKSIAQQGLLYDMTGK